MSPDLFCQPQHFALWLGKTFDLWKPLTWKILKNISFVLDILWICLPDTDYCLIILFFLLLIWFDTLLDLLNFHNLVCFLLFKITFRFICITKFQNVLQNCRMVIRQMSKAFRLVCQENLLWNPFSKTVPEERKECGF